MGKIQTRNLLFNKWLIMIGMIVSFTGQCASPESLQSADSLFNAGKYTESFRIYESILGEGIYSNSMLLKMAYIREGLNDVSGALYYLNLYYNKTSDKQVLQKMEEIAEANQLTGFESGDRDFFLNLYSKYEYYLIAILVTLSFFILGMMWYQKSRKRPTLNLRVAYLAILGVIFFLMNYGVSHEMGIISDRQTYLMTGPSAGADVHDIISKGHRVEVIGREGVWVKIRWQDDEVYVRENRIRVLG